MQLLYQREKVAWFMAMVRKAAPKVTEQETRTIEEWLRNQKK